MSDFRDFIQNGDVVTINMEQVVCIEYEHQTTPYTMLFHTNNLKPFRLPLTVHNMSVLDREHLIDVMFPKEENVTAKKRPRKQKIKA